MKVGDEEIPYGYCHCGCGQKTKIAKVNDKSNGTVKGEPMRYINHHYHMGRRNRIKEGYVLVYRPFHPRAMKDGYIYEHILVAEEMLGRPLLPGEVVHHKDGKRGNNTPENIGIFKNNGEHLTFHAETRTVFQKDYSAAVSLYEGGLSVTEVARRCSISRQGMWQILKRRGCIIRRKSGSRSKGVGAPSTLAPDSISYLR